MKTELPYPTPTRLRLVAAIERNEIRWYHFLAPEARNVVTDTKCTVVVRELAAAGLVDLGEAAATEELARVIDCETVEIKPDPLDVTAELETVDPSVPLFYTLRRPRPYVAESFTEGITRAQIERALEAGRPQ